MIVSASKDGIIKIWDIENGICLHTCNNTNGLFVQGIDFRNINPKSSISKEEKETLRQYGAIFDDDDAIKWQEAYNRLHSSYSKN